MTKNNKKLSFTTSNRLLSAFAFGSLLSACNSGSSSSKTEIESTTSLTGAVIKGPLQGALVYADSDGDGIGDGDPIMTGADGSYTIIATNADATIIAVTSDDTVDISSGEVLSGVTLKAPAGSSVVTPATTILEAQPDIEPAQLAVALGIPTVAADGTAIDLMSFNPYAADADPTAALAAEKAAQQVMVTIKAVSAAAEGAGMNAEESFKNAMASVAEVVSLAAEKIDVSSSEAIEAAQASIASGETVKIDFSDTDVLNSISSTVQTKVTEAAALDSTIDIDENAFASVMESAITAVENVNAKIELVEDLFSEESMGVFATVTDMASEVKAAAQAEVLDPGSGKDLVTFTDMSKVDDAAEAASLLVADKIDVAAAKFEQIYEEFLDTYPDDLSVDLINDVTDTTGLATEEDTKETEIAVPEIDIKDPTIVKEDTEETTGSSVGGDFVFAGGGAAPVDYSIYKIFNAKVISVTNDAIVTDIYADLFSASQVNPSFVGVTAFKLDLNTGNGFESDTQAMSGNKAFSWTNDVSLTSGSDTTGAISVNNSLSNGSVGNIVLVSGSDFSNSSTQVKLGTFTIDPVDNQSSLSLTISGMMTSGTGDLLINQTEFVTTLI
jgi:hypothetical protein